MFVVTREHNSDGRLPVTTVTYNSLLQCLFIVVQESANMAFGKHSTQLLDRFSSSSSRLV
jgi:hypothetical protein